VSDDPKRKKKPKPDLGRELMGSWRPPSVPRGETARERLRAVGPSLGMAIAGAAPGLGEMVDAYDMGAGLLKGDLPRAGMGAVGLALPFVAAGSLKRVADAATESPPPNAIRAYHGSPHDFDRFDMSKIGTGEGAQVYGHGLYFAENEDVARSYRTAGVRQPDYGEVATLLPASAMSNDNARRILDDISTAVADGEIANPSEYLDVYEVRPDLRAAYQRAAEILNRGPGKMYEVAIKADPDEFLDYDAPLSQQPPKVREAIESIDHPMYEGWRKSGYWPEHGTGASAYTGLAKHGMTRGAAKAGEHAEASKRLREAGIKGIKYLDQGSRTAGDGTRNYVVFDDSLVEILRKYGLAGLLGANLMRGNETEP
jgi:hypothetical protein